MNDEEKLTRIKIIVDGYPSHNSLAQAIREILEEPSEWTDSGSGPGYPAGEPYDPRD